MPSFSKMLPTLVAEPNCNCKGNLLRFMEVKMNEVDTKRVSYYPTPQVDLELDPDLDAPWWLSQEPAPDPMRESDAIFEIIDDTDLRDLLGRMVDLEIYLNEPYAFFPGDRDTEGVDITEYPFG